MEGWGRERGWGGRVAGGGGVVAVGDSQDKIHHVHHRKACCAEYQSEWYARTPAALTSRAPTTGPYLVITVVFHGAGCA